MPDPLRSLSGRQAVVAGATGAHAPSVALALQAQGASVTVLDRSADALRRFAERRVGGPGAPMARVCDMTEAGIAAAVADLAARGPGLDILVTCPPEITEAPRPIEDGDHFRDTLAATLEPAYRWTRIAADAMRARGAGVIVHVTGLSGLGGWPGWDAAGAAFSGVHSLVRSFAPALAPHGVRINALVPGVTPAQGAAIARAVGRPTDTVRARIPLGAWMPDGALGNGLVYLVHPTSSYVTGEVLAVDGGWDMWGRLHAVAAA